jgi:hypothetical protein
MRDYKGWTAKERLASLKKTKAAISAGIIPPPTECNRCGKTTGRIDYHNHDYSDPVKYLEQICQGCHTRLHRLENKGIDASSGCSNIKEVVPKNANIKSMMTEMTYEDKLGLVGAVEEINNDSGNASSDLNTWLEKGMTLPLEELADHIRTTPVGVKPLHALRGLGIVFSGGFTKLYNCSDYPQTEGLGRDRQRLDVVVERIRFHERNGESLKVKGVALSEKLESNYIHNR